MSSGIRNPANTMILSTRKELMESFSKAMPLLKYENLVKVTLFKPTNDGTEGLMLGLSNMEHLVDYECVMPVIENTKVTWGYAEEYIRSALKIFNELYKTPRFMCFKESAPLLIEEDKMERNDLDIVIGIAPRIWG